MIEDKATEKLKKRLKDKGLIVNMGVGRTESPPSTEKRANDKKNSNSKTSVGKKSRKK
jgi:hypothetical protein